ncbi:MAG: 16S rRNA (adenine(1518)-N(6)/adenine(1519)-N(6))-dimethyltransferase RsmA [Minisyncoccia bacterium]
MSRINPQKRLGQVFLKNKKYLEKIIKAGEISQNDIILEIGAGSGVLTEALLQTGAKIVAIEKDPQLVKFLQEKFKNHKNLTIIGADIRDFLKNKSFYTKYKIQNTEYKVVGNIPYYLTSHLLRLLLELEKKPQIIVLMIQKEVAQRIIAQPPKMNLLAVSVQFFAKPEIIAYVPKSAFWPQPKVDSAIIKLTPIHTDMNTDKQWIDIFFRILKAGFSQPRKLLISNLQKTLKIEKNKIIDAVLKINIPLNSRSQNLSLKDWQNLTNLLLS